MKIHVELDRYLRILSILLILGATLSDFIRQRMFVIGPLQYFIIGTGLGAFSFSLLPHLLSRPVKHRTIAAILFFTSAGLSSLAVYNHNIPMIFFIVCGILAGAGTAVTVSILQWKKGEKPVYLLYSLFFAILISSFLFRVSTDYINLDLWFDEIFTLDRFVFGSLQNTLTNYISTNNHIFLNIINHLYLRVIGVQDIYDLLGKVYQLRLLMLVYALVTLLYIFLTGLKFFHHPSVAGVAVVVLATTVPFYNFAVQVRGYGLSSMLVSMLVYYGWSYEEKPEHHLRWTILILSTLLLYTLPSNLYLLGPIGLFYVTRAVVKLLAIRKQKQELRWMHMIQSTDRNEQEVSLAKDVVPILSISSGGILTVLLYLPVVQQFFSQAPSTAANGTYTFRPLTVTFPIIFRFLLSERWLFLALLLLAFVLLLSGLVHKSMKPHFKKLLVFSYLILMPFIINQLYGQIPYTRVFVMISPLFALWITAAFECCLFSMHKSHSFPWILFSLLTLYCYYSFFQALEMRDDHILSDIKEGKISQNIFFNYYQAYYHPYDTIKEFTETIQKPDIPVFVYHWGDTQSTPYYLKKGFVTYHVIDQPGDLKLDEIGHAFVFSALPMKSIEEITLANPGSSCRLENQQLDFLDILFCETGS